MRFEFLLDTNSAQDRRVHVEGLIQKFGLEQATKRLRMTIESLELMRARWRGD